MYQKSNSILFIFLFFCVFAKGQSTIINDSLLPLPVDFQFTISGKFSFVTSDDAGNIYGINTSGRFIKYNSNGDSLTAYNEVLRFGKPVSADVSNPFKILLVYQRIPSVSLLDRQLSFQGNIPFRQKGLINVNAISASYDNRIWLFNQQQFTLQKYDDVFTLVQESNDVRQLTDDAIVPGKIIDENNRVVLYDDQNGFYVFDYYGNFQTKIPFLHWYDVCVHDEKYVGRINDTLHVYDRTQFLERVYSLPVSGKINSMYISHDKLMISDQTGILVYKIQQPIF